MAAAQKHVTLPVPRRDALAYQWRVLRVIAQIEFKLKYADSALGYVWSLLKPLALFSVLWVVFGRLFRVGANFPDYPLYLIIGIVLWTFFSDATTLTMYSLVTREALLRKLSFPRLVIPVATTLVALTTFAVNLVAIAFFVGWRRLVPHLDWLLVIPLLLELYLFIIAVSVILATLFVKFRDVSQIWELLAQLLFYASPIIYPLGYLPPWARSVSMLNPLAQVVQDVRALIIYHAPPHAILRAPDVLGRFGYVFPLLVLVALCAFALWLFRREEPWLAERV